MKNGLLKNFLYTWLIGLILVGIIYLVFGSKRADASTIASQPIDTTLSGSIQTIDSETFTGYSGAVGSATFKVNNYTNSTSLYYALYLRDTTNSISYVCKGDLTGTEEMETKAINGDQTLIFDCSNAGVYPSSFDTPFIATSTITYKFSIFRNQSAPDTFKAYGDGSTPYFLFESDVFVPDYTSHFDSISFSTTTNKVNVTGYWNATTTPNIIEQVSFNQYSIMLGEEANATTIATTTGNFDLYFDYIPLPTPYTGATTTATITSDLYFYAKLYQIDNNYYNPFGEQDIRYSTLLDATSTILTASTTDLWNIGSTTAGLFLYPEYICDITSITGCIKNALIWAFYPTQKTVENFYNLQTLVQSKAPFGYFSVVKTGINSLSATSTPTFSITIPNSLKIYIFNPFDIAISSILWLFFIFNLYKRLKHITI